MRSRDWMVIVSEGIDARYMNVRLAKFPVTLNVTYELETEIIETSYDMKAAFPSEFSALM